MTTAPADTPAARHREDSARFTELVESASDRDRSRPSPVAEWTARDIVKHLIEWSRGFLGGAGIEFTASDIAADPAGRGKSMSPISRPSSTTRPAGY